MKKSFMGVRLKRLRDERQLTQAALAGRLGISLSYLNQLENNQRPLTVPVLLALNAAFGLDVQMFAEDDEARLISDLREALSDPALGETIATAELRELALNMPAVGRVLVGLNQKYRRALEQTAALAARLGEDRQAEATILPSTPFEEVRDFFYAQHNYFPVLDEAAEAMGARMQQRVGQPMPALQTYLTQHHGISVVIDAVDDLASGTQRRFDPRTRTIYLSPRLRPGQQAFQLGTQIAMLALDSELRDLVDKAGLTSNDARGLARIGLANYFASALILPYTQFLEAAEQRRYDIDLLGHQFGVGFETVCHRLSTLQRPGARGISFFFIRVDRAGNISKRQSATDFHFSRVGGTCPLWNVYEAFASPGRILTQLARMPDERTYLWIARTVSHGRGGYGAPGKSFAVALGCDVRHAERIVYSQGLDTTDPSSATPIGVGCKVCERLACPQRAFPAVGRDLTIDDTRTRFAPYATSM
ncbi:short-chain fatty acyl-CoA regulator family protein [Bradyrhizobium prioriisuperbiae]|uniref:short-chain fatty acyl-CoA regulator family protein n=1 Tax=Bradyrhizobium prioriisuperbiae TaxID=2854389 RepID=UPI0028E5633A|nr:short-chain fatty acyl-CoA regulator family protein [Bradyrhizobium prioritasuperba]